MSDSDWQAHAVLSVEVVGMLLVAGGLLIIGGIVDELVECVDGRESAIVGDALWAVDILSQAGTRVRLLRLRLFFSEAAAEFMSATMSVRCQSCK